VLKALTLNHLVTKVARHQLLKKTARPFPPFGTSFCVSLTHQRLGAARGGAWSHLGHIGEKQGSGGVLMRYSTLEPNKLSPETNLVQELHTAAIQKREQLGV